MPPGGARHDLAERQVAPALIRLRMHQLIQGHNLHCFRTGEQPLRAHRIQNAAVCLLQQGIDYRLLKASSRFPTRPSGHFQEGLINQDRYWRLVKGGENRLDFGEEPEAEKPLLEGLIYYHLARMELLSAYVVIPDGFTEDDRVNVAGSQELELFELEDLARFEASGVIDTQMKGESVLLSEAPLDPDAIANPYEESALTEEEVQDSLESDSPSRSVLNDKQADLEND